MKTEELIKLLENNETLLDLNIRKLFDIDKDKQSRELFDKFLVEGNSINASIEYVSAAIRSGNDLNKFNKIFSPFLKKSYLGLIMVPSSESLFENGKFNKFMQKVDDYKTAETYIKLFYEFKINKKEDLFFELFKGKYKLSNPESIYTNIRKIYGFMDKEIIKLFIEQIEKQELFMVEKILEDIEEDRIDNKENITNELKYLYEIYLSCFSYDRYKSIRETYNKGVSKEIIVLLSRIRWDWNDDLFKFCNALARKFASKEILEAYDDEYEKNCAHQAIKNTILYLGNKQILLDKKTIKILNKFVEKYKCDKENISRLNIYMADFIKTIINSPKTTDKIRTNQIAVKNLFLNLRNENADILYPSVISVLCEILLDPNLSINTDYKINALTNHLCNVDFGDMYDRQIEDAFKDICSSKEDVFYMNFAKAYEISAVEALESVKHYQDMYGKNQEFKDTTVVRFRYDKLV